MKGNKIIALILFSLLFSGVVFAQFAGPLWYPDDTSLFPIDDAWHIGSSDTRIAKGWFTDVDISGTLDLGGIVGSGGIDMNSNIITNIGNTGTDFVAGGGLNLDGDLSFVGAQTISTTTGNLSISSAAGDDVLIGDDSTFIFVDGGTNTIGFFTTALGNIGVYFNPSLTVSGSSNNRGSFYNFFVQDTTGTDFTGDAIALYGRSRIQSLNVSDWTGTVGLRGVMGENVLISPSSGTYTVTGAASFYAMNDTAQPNTTLTNQYGIYFEDLTTGTNDYGLFFAGNPSSGSIASASNVDISITPGGTGNTLFSDGTGVVIGHTAQIDFGAIPEFQVLGTGTPDASMGFARFENNASAPDVRFLKSRGTTIGSNVIVQDGDTLGRIRFQGADTIDFNTTAAELIVKVDGSPSSNDIPGKFVFRTRTAAGSLSDKVTIDNAGTLDMLNNLITNIGNAGTDFTATGGLVLAGDTAVNSKLTINQSSNNHALVIDSNATDGSAINIVNPSTTGDEVLNISNADALTIGTIMFLSSNSSDTSARNLVQVLNDNTLATGATLMLLRQDSTGDVLRVFDGGTQRFTIDDEGNVDMVTKIITNIGDSGTDFTSTGALNLADTLSINRDANGQQTPLKLQNIPATAANFDGNIMAFTNKNSAGATVTGLQLLEIITDVTDGGEDVDLAFKLMNDGTFTEIARFVGSTLAFNLKSHAIINIGSTGTDFSSAGALTLRVDTKNPTPLNLENNPGTAAQFDLVNNAFRLKNDAGSRITGFSQQALIRTITSGSEDVDYIMRIMDGGTLTEWARVRALRFGIGTTDPQAKHHIDQSSSSGAIPVLILDQGDIDDSFVDFIGTSAADGTRSISSDTTEDSAKFGAIRIEINGVTKWIRVYDDES